MNLATRITGKERDSETQLDYFGARYYGSNMGRWMSPDWAGKPTAVPYANFGDPQTLNLYGYVRNNPLWRADVDGDGFWKKLKNVLTDGGWNEDPEAQKERIKRETQRQQQDKKLDEEWAKQHPGTQRPRPVGIAATLAPAANAAAQATKNAAGNFGKTLKNRFPRPPQPTPGAPPGYRDERGNKTSEAALDELGGILAGAAAGSIEFTVPLPVVNPDLLLHPEKLDPNLQPEPI